MQPQPLQTMATRPPNEDEMWRAVIERDAALDGTFVYGVVTTGVYCRPSCPSRNPLRANVRFFATGEAAEEAGLRACKRCRPGQDEIDTHAAIVARVCRIIETSEQQPQLAELASAVGLSPWHLHRLFRKATGVTPKGYAKATREQRLRAGLPQARTVTEAIYDAGFSSSGRLYDDARGVLGMKPSSRHRAGAGERIRFAVGKCSLGQVLVAATEHGVCDIALGDDPEVLLQAFQDRFRHAELVGGDAGFEALVARVVALVEAPHTGAALPLDIRGTAFQQRVWAALRRIPAGATASYAEVATAIGAPGAARAVARACASNRLAVAIPCHRVVRRDGGLSGYRWGVARKRELLDREARS